MPEHGARPLVGEDGELLHSYLNLKAIGILISRKRLFTVLIRIKQFLRNGSAFLTSICIDLGISTSSDVSLGAGEN